MPSHHLTDRALRVVDIRNTEESLRLACLRAVPRRPLPGGLAASLDALRDAAASLAAAAPESSRDLQLVFSVAATLIYLEDTFRQAGIAWPADALTVRPEHRAPILELFGDASGRRAA